MQLKVTGTGTATRVKVTDPAGVITTYEPVGTPTANADYLFVVTSVEDPASTETSTYVHDAAGRVTRILAAVPDGVGPCSATGALAAGCRALGITYATVTTATAIQPGDKAGQISAVSMLVGSTTSGVHQTTTKSLATYAYDTDGRLVSVTDPRPTPALTTRYSYDGTSNRLKTITPPGLKPITYEYADSGSKKLTKVTRTKTDNSGEARQATILYNIPTSGTDATNLGLPNLDTDKVAKWGQDAAPSYAAAVFGADRPDAPTTIPTSASEIWKDAQLTYTDSRGAQLNTAAYGAGAWTYTSVSYDEHDNPIRSLDAGDIDAILGETGDGSAGIAPAEAGTLARYNTAQTVPDAAAPGGTRTVLEAGSVVTDSWGPARWILTANGQRVWARPRTHTDYDQNAPNGGVNPTTGQAYALPTTVTVTAEHATPGPDYGTTIETYSITRTTYDTAINGGATQADKDKGWALGLAGTVTTDMTGSPGSTTDIVTQSRYDAAGRLISTSQPTSTGGDAGTRVTDYYTAGSGGACVNSAWAGLVCRTRYAGAPSSGPELVTATVTGYSDLLDPTTVVETPRNASGTTLRTTTTTYGADGRVLTSAVSANATAVAGSTPVGSTTYGYDSATGLPTTTTTAAAGGSPGGTITTGYDTWGRPTTYTTKSGTDPAETTTTSYDTAGRVASVQDPKGTTTWTYDGTDAAGASEHRGLPTRLTITKPGGDLSITGAYDRSGALVRQNLPGGVIQRASYDAAGEPTSLSYSGQVTRPDENGNPVTTQDQAWLSWSQSSDALGRVRREWTPAGAGFDPGGTDGTATGASATGYARDYTYDRAARLVAVSDQTVPNAEAATGGVDPEDPGTLAQTVCQRRSYAFDANGNRTALTRTPANTDGTCQAASAPGSTTKTWTYDTADRITGGYTYDPLGRATTVPQSDTPAANGPTPTTPGALALGYYDTDAAKTITQNGTSTSFTLDPAGRRLASTTGPTGGTGTTTTRHYTDPGDNPGWTSTSATAYERYGATLSGDLGLTITTSGATTTATLALGNLHGDTPTQVTLPATGNALGIDNWTDTDEYGNPLTTTPGTTPTNTTATGSTDGTLGYGWLGAKERATDASGLLLMGARLYNPITGQFTSTDPVYGGNTTAYAYPQDPVNMTDLDGRCARGFGWACKAGRAIGRFLGKHHVAILTGGSIAVCTFAGPLSCALISVATAAVQTRQKYKGRLVSKSAATDFAFNLGVSAVGAGAGRLVGKAYAAAGRARHWTEYKLNLELGIASAGISLPVRGRPHKRGASAAV